jgi:protein-S-isoprenylcysteine O-methyltransferase Ste14
MLTRTFFWLLLIGAPTALAVKIRMQRRALGRSPVVLGVAADGVWARWFERLGPLGLCFWPASWFWVAVGGAPLRPGVLGAIGLMIMAVGAIVSLASIFLMGRAWRIGIDPENRSELAEGGPYRWVRHPIYSGWLLMLIGQILVVPHLMIDCAALLTAVGVTIQAHREEQHLHRTFGERYGRYAARTGRFAPRLWQGRA